MIAITLTGKDRAPLLARALESFWHQAVLPAEIILTDCSDDHKATTEVVQAFRKYATVPIRHIWKHKSQLTRSQGRQLAVVESTQPLVVSTETDIVLPPNTLRDAVQAFGLPPYERLYLQTALIKNNEDGSPGKLRQHHRSGAFQMFRRVDFDAVGGYNPFLGAGWGYEDTDFMNRLVASGCERRFLTLAVTHLWHPEMDDKRSNLHNQQIAKNTFWDAEAKEWRWRDLSSTPPT